MRDRLNDFVLILCLFAELAPFTFLLFMLLSWVALSGILTIVYSLVKLWTH